MRVIVLLLTLALASVSGEPTYAQAVLRQCDHGNKVGTFVFEQADSSELLRVYALKVLMGPGKYVAVANTVADPKTDSRCYPAGTTECRILPDNDEGGKRSFQIFTMEIHNNGSQTIHNISTLATLALNHTHSIISGAITVYDDSTFIDAQSTPISSSLACGEVEVRGRAILFFANGPPRSIAANLTFTRLEHFDDITLRGSFFDFPPGDYALMPFSRDTKFIDCDSLRIPPRWELPRRSFWTTINIDHAERSIDVVYPDVILKLNQEGSVIGRPIGVYDLETRDSNQPWLPVACGMVVYD